MKNYHQQGGLTFKNIINSFRNAFRGLVLLAKYEYNLYIQTVFAIIAIAFGFIFGISSVEWMVQIIVIGLVLFSELINTSIEKIMDLVQPEYNEKVRDIKDLAAGSVLFTSLISVSVGLIIYIPKIISLLN